MESNQVSCMISAWWMPIGCWLREPWAAPGRGCKRVALENTPRHSQHSGASRCHSNGGHSTASRSSRSKSCRLGVRCRCCRWNRPGARVYHIRPFPRRWLGLLPSWSVCSSSMTRGKNPDENRQSTGVPDPASGHTKPQLQERPFLKMRQDWVDKPVKWNCSASS